MNRNDVPLGQGQCDIRLQVDGEAEASVRGDQVYIHTLSGRDSRDDGSECNESFPAREAQNLRFEVKDSRGEIAMLGQGRNGAVVRIRDSKGGEGRYHFRLTWDTAAGGMRPGGGFGNGSGFGNGGFGANQAIEICREAVQDRISRDTRASRVDVRLARVDDKPGRNDYILGEAMARRGGSSQNYTFACRVDFSTGRVRSVDVNRR